MGGGSSEGWIAAVGEHPLLRQRPLQASALTVVLVAAALAVRLALDKLLVGVPFVTFYAIVALSAFVGGWVQGGLATVLSVLAAGYFLVPRLQPAPLSSEMLGAGAFALTCLLMVLLTHIAVTAAESSARLARQRQVLLIELQHRIKNHLQLLGAMLATHSRATTNDRIRARLEEAGRRLQVIAATYDNLYEPGALIDMNDHLRKVCAFIEGGVGTGGARFTVDAVSTRWPVERVIPLSLIANELLTNSVKHSPPGADLAVNVRLARDGTRMRFTVETLDIRLPDAFDVTSAGLGLKIAGMLAEQLGGRLETPDLPRALFVVEFPEAP